MRYTRGGLVKPEALLHLQKICSLECHQLPALCTTCVAQHSTAHTRISPLCCIYMCLVDSTLNLNVSFFTYWVAFLSKWEAKRIHQKSSTGINASPQTACLYLSLVAHLHIAQCLTFLIAATGLTPPLQGLQARAQSTTPQPTSGAVQWQPTKLQHLGAPTPPTPILPPPPHPISLHPHHPHNLLGTSNISSRSHSSKHSSSKVILQQQ